MISLDTETTGVDLYHGSKPFFITVCDEEYNQTWWEWDVDPLTREPDVHPEDLGAVWERLEAVRDGTQEVVGQNLKFDIAALRTVGLDDEWPWQASFDTLIAGHLLASNQPHNLTDMVLMALGDDIEPLEKALEEAVKQARSYCRRYFKDWRIAKAGCLDMPSVDGGSKRDEDKPWKNDTWLPRALAKRLEYPPTHPWHTVLRDYANADSAYTLALYKWQEGEMKRRGLWDIYLWRVKLPRVVLGLESNSVTVIHSNMTELERKYTSDVVKMRAACVEAADGKISELPVNGVSNALRSVIFDHFGLKSSRTTDTGNPSLDKYAIEDWLNTLDAGTKAAVFVRNLAAYRRRKTALSYIESYQRFMLPLRDGYYVIHPSLNPTGTATLRCSSYNPNSQQISKQGIAEMGGSEEGKSARFMFGPAPDREWWSMDAKNIELRIPAYEASETEMIDLFERPDDPPYFGSNHLLVCHVLHKELFEQCKGEDGKVDGRLFKKRYADTKYQWVKNGNFAVQYGAVERPDGLGTADRAYRVPGAQALIKQRFSRLDALNRRCIEFAERNGYVETIPDSTVDPNRGYPLLCSRTEWGRVLPTVPLNYHVQGTAMWWMCQAMIRCQEQLDEWRHRDGFDGKIVLQVHDELVFDFPRRGDPIAESKLRGGKGPLFRTSTTSNLWRVRVLQKVMASGGDGIGVPTPVSCEYHPDNWSEGRSV